MVDAAASMPPAVAGATPIRFMPGIEKLPAARTLDVALPLIMRIGLKNLKTRHPLAHEIRAFVSALGVHVFVYGFASGVPIWQMVTLLSTGPLFIILGSTLFLGERASTARIAASLVAFAGAIIVSGVGAE
eukprot:gene15583-21116_t